MFKTPGRFKEVERFQEILATVVKMELGFFLEYIGLKEKELDKISEKPTPERLKNLLQELGGGFAHLGIFLSRRPDLVPKSYCAEFSKIELSDKEAMPPEEVEKAIKRGTGKEVNELFQSLILQPDALTATGQLHKGTLNGSHVEIKLKRPGIEEELAADIDIMTYLSNLMEKNFSMKLFKPSQIIDEFTKYLEKQLDYKKEAKKIEKLYSRYRDKAPKVHWKYCNKNLMVTDYDKDVSEAEVYNVLSGSQEVKSHNHEASRIIIGTLAFILVIISYIISDLSQGEIFGYPELSFAGISVAVILMLALALSLAEEKLGWKY